VADTARILGMKPIKGRVSPKVAKKVMSVNSELADLGVEVERHRVKFKSDVVGMIRNVWLLYTIAKEAVGRWPQIRKVLVKAGLTPYEITTLNLSQSTKKKSVEKKKK
jgi:hypothetical protein